MSDIGKLLVIIGFVFIVLGLLLAAGYRGLPGDIVIQKKNTTFFFPIATSIVLSLVLTFILLLMRK